jgi:energy-coupling factor transporter ATP-binding protein EcfA2
MNDSTGGSGSRIRPDALVAISEVAKRYEGGGEPALDRVTLDAAAGAVMGTSGSGKSTLLNLIAGLDKPTSGTITVAGQRIDQLSETRLAQYRRTQVGMRQIPGTAVGPSACLLAVRWRDGTPERGTLRARLTWIGIAVGRRPGSTAIASCQRQRPRATSSSYAA